jgi:hypothetical protein
VHVFLDIWLCYCKSGNMREMREERWDTPLLLLSGVTVNWCSVSSRFFLLYLDCRAERHNMFEVASKQFVVIDDVIADVASRLQVAKWLLGRVLALVPCVGSPLWS